MRIVAVAVAVVSACLMQEVSGRVFLSKAVTKVADPETHMTEEKGENNYAALSGTEDITMAHTLDLKTLSDRAEALNKVAEKDGASDEAIREAAQADEDLEKAQDLASLASSDDDSQEPDEDAQSGDFATDKLDALFDELDKENATEGASGALMNAAAQEAVKNLEKADERAAAKLTNAANKAVAQAAVNNLENDDAQAAPKLATEANKAVAQAQAQLPNKAGAQSTPLPKAMLAGFDKAGAQAKAQLMEANAGGLDNDEDEEGDDEFDDFADDEDEGDLDADDDHEADDYEEDEY